MTSVGSIGPKWWKVQAVFDCHMHIVAYMCLHKEIDAIEFLKE